MRQCYTKQGQAETRLTHPLACTETPNPPSMRHPPIQHREETHPYCRPSIREQRVGWGGAKRYPSTAARNGDGFRKGLNPSYVLRASIREQQPVDGFESKGLLAGQ